MCCVHLARWLGQSFAFRSAEFYYYWTFPIDSCYKPGGIAYPLQARIYFPVSVDTSCLRNLLTNDIKSYLRMKRVFSPNPSVFILFWNAVPTPSCMKAFPSIALFPIISSIVWYCQIVLIYYLVYCFENVVNDTIWKISVNFRHGNHYWTISLLCQAEVFPLSSSFHCFYGFPPSSEYRFGLTGGIIRKILPR